jgi:hypothetical protein
MSLKNNQTKRSNSYGGLNVRGLDKENVIRKEKTNIFSGSSSQKPRKQWLRVKQVEENPETEKQLKRKSQQALEFNLERNLFI